MGTHSYKVKRLFSGMLRFQKYETAPSSLNCYLLYWLNRRPVALVYECDSRLAWLHVAVAYWAGCVLSHFVLVCPNPVTSGLLFDVVAARAIAFLVRGALWEGKLIHLRCLLLRSQERLYRHGQIQIREKTANRWATCVHVLETQDKPFVFVGRVNANSTCTMSIKKNA